MGAYTYLLNYHRDWYVDNDPQKHTKKIYQGKGGQWYLTNAEKKRILLNNIFGVDIDSQAIEVTKLSLLLKVLEGEDAQTLENQYRLFHERALPDLATNIKCGNSLIGPDFFDDYQRLAPAPVAGGSHETTSTNDLYQKINPFDWHTEFPQIFSGKNPGFDAVIGNPPYVRIQTMKETQPQSVPYFSSKYQSASKGNYDIYVVFVEKSLQMLNNRGRMGYILPHKFFNAKYGQPLRNLISKGKHLSHVVHFGHQQVFVGATTYTCLLFLNKSSVNMCQVSQITDLPNWLNTSRAITGSIPAESITPSEWNFVVGPSTSLFERLKAIKITLGDIAHIFVGTQTSANTIFVLCDCHITKTHVVGTCGATSEKVQIERDISKPFLRGKQIRRYETPTTRDYLVCPYLIEEDKFRLMSETELSTQYPLAYAHLKSHKSILERREKGKFKGTQWFAFGYPKSMTLFQHPKIVVPDYNNVPSFTLDDRGHFYKTGYGITLSNAVQESPLYILGLLNTTLLFQYLLHIGTSLRGGYIRFWTQFIQQLPIRRIDFDNPDDKSKHDQTVKLVERMLDLHKKLATAKIPDDKTRIQRQIDTTDKQIDSLVYELYDLTEEEIAIVEQNQ